MDEHENKASAIVVMEPDSPVRELKPDGLRRLAQSLSKTFKQYESDRDLSEKKWMKNLRQYLGLYDPEIERTLDKTRSRAYPRLTRVKCVSVVSRVMGLMFPGNERNWSLKASPSADMDPMDVQAALKEMQEKSQKAGVESPTMNDEMIASAVQTLANQRAEMLSLLIDDQMQEIGGDQTSDYVRLNKKVVDSGVKYGVGYLRGPSVRKVQRVRWRVGPSGQPEPQITDVYKPRFDFAPVWDVYIDMSASCPEESEGYFIRLVMSKTQLLKLSKRDDYFEKMVKKVMEMSPKGNYKPKGFETELRSMGVSETTDAAALETGKYEVLVWFGPLDGRQLSDAGVEVSEGMLDEEIRAEVWMSGDIVIKAEVNAWSQMDVDMRQLHSFVFDEDDTSPVGNGLPNVIRDSQMGVAAATRMLMDNASVTCGPNIEVNTDLMELDQDITSIASYKTWYRTGMGADANVPAVRNITIDNHMGDLTRIIEVFSAFADTESFVGAATGGDMERGFSEPMRTAAGASMLRGDAALPFKDIVRNFDSFTQSVIQALVMFNRKLNPDKAPAGDFNVIARGATSLIAKEIRGIQIDQLAQTLAPEDRLYVDERKFTEARFKVRDLDDMLVPKDEADRRLAAKAEREKKAAASQEELIRAEIRDVLSSAFKNITQGQKNVKAADVATVNAAMTILTKGGEHELRQKQAASVEAASGDADQAAAGPAGRA